jgi:predicted nuclease of predicted toxin-antitoxin system
MKFLVDNPVSPEVARILRLAGHDAVHVQDRNLQRASDPIIFACAAKEHRILVTADTDFGLLLARAGTKEPSVVLFHHSFSHRPSEQGTILLETLPQLSSSLEQGSIAVLESHRIRIRTLPIGG